MSPLEKLLSEEAKDKSNVPRKGDPGVESDWIDFGEIACKSGKFLVIDPAFAPEEESGVLVKCPTGVYQLAAKVMSYASDRRVSRLRALKVGTKIDSKKPLKKIGEAWADVASIGVCDLEEFAKIFPDDESQAEDLINEYLERDSSAGSLIVEGRNQTPLRYVNSGFGDGTFPVFAHVVGGKRVGFEVEFIAEGTPYPFDAPSTDLPPTEERKADPVLDAVFSALKGYKKTGDRDADKKQLRALLEKAAAPFEQDLRDSAEEIRRRLIERRKTAPPMEIRFVPFSQSDLTEDELSKLKELEQMGFVNVGSFTCELPNYRASFALQPETGIFGDVSPSGEKTRVAIGFYREDQTSFFVRNFFGRPGVPAGDWNRTLDMPDGSIRELMERVQRSVASGPIARYAVGELPRVVERQFRRTQMWRADRGGWTRKEIELQLNKPNIEEDELQMWRFELSDVWLYNWLRAQTGLPFDPAQELSNLVMVHDDIPSHLLQSIWVWSTGDVKTRAHLFEEGSPRETFARINDGNGMRLRMVTHKTTGYLADFYLPA